MTNSRGLFATSKPDFFFYAPSTYKMKSDVIEKQIKHIHTLCAVANW